MPLALRTLHLPSFLLAALLAAPWPAPAQIFTHPPTEAAHVAGVEPRGGVNGSSHVLAVDRMYLRYPDPFNGGADTFPVYAMGDGQLVMVVRSFPDDIPDPDYEIVIRHTKKISSQYDHLHGLEPDVLAWVDSIPEAWIPLGDDSEVLFLGQLGAPDPLPLVAGQQVGITRSHFFSWDVGVIDRSQSGGSFLVHRRYPSIPTLLELLGIALERRPYPGNNTLHSGCFIDYMPPALRAQWFALLLSTPKTCGRAGWDLATRIRGHWFNPEVDEIDPPPLFSLERAALSILPDHLAPLTHAAIAIGSDDPLSLVDPTGMHPQLEQEFHVATDATPGAKINPDPARVGVATGSVCYDLAFELEGTPGYNVLMLRLEKKKRLRVHFDPTHYTFPACIAVFQEDPEWDATYVR